MPTTYAAVTDLLIGNMPLGDMVDPQKMLDDAADEIDSKIGVRYVTPVDMNGLSRSSALLIKRLAVYLATGRIYLTIAAPQENSNVNALGAQYLKQANDALNAILAGDVPLDGATPIRTNANESFVGVTNGDTGSFVDSFYKELEPGYPAGLDRISGRFFGWS